MNRSEYTANHDMAIANIVNRRLTPRPPSPPLPRFRKFRGWWHRFIAYGDIF